MAIAGTPGSAGDTTADFELGQFDFTHGVPQFITAKSLDFGAGGHIAIDPNSNPNHLYVADAANNRILAWDNAVSFINGQTADLIIGQPDQYSRGANQTSTVVCAPGDCGTATLATLAAPTWIAVDSNGKLWVSDSNNLRVLEYSDPFTQTPPVVASNAYPFSTTDCGTNGPGALAFDAGDNLYLGTSNGLVEEFNNSGFSGLSAANRTFGTALACNNGLFYTCVTDASHLCNVGGIAISSGADYQIYVADGIANLAENRVMVYDESASPPNSSTASFVIGQPNFTTAGTTVPPTNKSLNNPRDVKLDGSGNVFVSDTSNHRVLEFAGPITANQPAADNVLGQQGSFTTGSCDTGTAVGDQIGIGPDSLCNPLGMAFDSSDNFYLADDHNARVLRFDLSSSLDAVAELGQTDLVHGTEDFVNPASMAGEAGLDDSTEVAIDRNSSPNHLYVLDVQNNRVLGWQNAESFINGATADHVLGQPDFYTVACNYASLTGGGDFTGNFDFGGQAPSATTLCTDGSFNEDGFAVDPSGNVWVADAGNTRVVRFPSPYSSGKTAGESADLVLGWSDFVSNGGGPYFASGQSPTDFNFDEPDAVAIDSIGRVYVSDQSIGRILRFDPPFSDGQAAVQVFSTGGSFTTSGFCSSATADTICFPDGMAIDKNDNLWVTDDGASRVLEFNTPATVNALCHCDCNRNADCDCNRHCDGHSYCDSDGDRNTGCDSDRHRDSDRNRNIDGHCHGDTHCHCDRYLNSNRYLDPGLHAADLGQTVPKRRMAAIHLRGLRQSGSMRQLRPTPRASGAEPPLDARPFIAIDIHTHCGGVLLCLRSGRTQSLASDFSHG